MRPPLFFAPFLMITLLISPAEAAPTNTTTGSITRLSGGWVNANMRVQTSFAWINPDNCTYSDGYMIDPADNGHELFSSMVLSAFLSHRQVQLTLDGCFQGRPRIIAVEIVE